MLLKRRYHLVSPLLYNPLFMFYIIAFIYFVYTHLRKDGIDKGLVALPMEDATEIKKNTYIVCMLMQLLFYLL